MAWSWRQTLVGDAIEVALHDLPYFCRISASYLPYICPIPALYLPYICPISALYLPYISPKPSP